MVDHYAIFLGYRKNSPVFVANYKDGVKEINPTEMQKFLKTLEPVEVVPFKGNESERKMRLKEQFQELGKKLIVM